ncbi:MAG TPA: serine hydrolase [Bacteroidales bacterium]|nr:serine hydrolase [Bacteroidales bacterium]
MVAAIFLFHSCHVARYVFWNYADVGDAVKFPSVPVKNDPAHPSPIPSVPSRNLDVPRGFNDTASPLPFREFLEKNYTLSFLVVRNDTLIYSYYRTGYDSASLLPSFSVAKSFVSALTGIALAEGYLKNVRQTVTDLLPEIRDPGFRKVTIQDLLTMRSGIRFNEGYTDPFSEMAKFYYGLNLRKYTLKLKTRIPPDSLYEYQSGNAEILGMILERVTGRSLAAYLEEKIWIPMGMEGEATWNTDSKKHMEIKSFCCINARAVDFAKFGMLYLHQGYWNGMPVVPEKWVKESLMIRNDSRDSQGYPYGYMWRTLEDGSFFAKGILGQYIFVDPARRLVIVHCGMKAGNVNWVEFFRSLARQFS